MSTEESAPLLGDSSSPRSEESLTNRIKTILSSPNSLNQLEKLLALLSIVLLLATATGWGLFAGEAVKHHGKNGHDNERTRVPLPDKPGKNSETCLTSTCVTVASTIINSLDETINPCEDFYQFANGGWLKSHPTPDDLGFFGIAQDIGVRNKQKILSILSSPPSLSLPIADQTNLNHLRSFYQSCLNENALDRVGLEPFLKVVEMVVGNWRGDHLGEGLELVDQSVSSGRKEGRGGRWDEKSRKDRLTSTLSILHAHAIPTLFESYAESDVLNDPESIILWLKQSGLTLPSKDYYKDEEVLSLYTEVIGNILSEVFEARNERVSGGIEKLAKNVVDFEVKLAQISLDVEALEDPLTTYNPQSSSQLKKLFPLISFQDYFSSFNPRPQFPDPVIVTSTKYLEDLTDLLRDTEEEVLEGYFLSRIAFELAPLLGPKESIRKEVESMNNFLSGIEQGVKPSRVDVCLASLLENYGFLIGKYYVELAFTGDSKAYAEEIIIATIQAFKDRLPELDWLDAPTRERAEKKASAITYKIGYPTSSPNTTNAASLARYYSLNLPISSDDFFGNVLRSKIADQIRLWVSVGRIRDGNTWDMIPSEVNAYYSPPANEIVFPAGILQSPYFSKHWPEYMAFGAFGSVAGHELSHAFDQSGRLYNEIGKLEDWWTNTTTAKFEELQECLFKQYAAYTVVGPKGELHHVNSHFTNGEDSADAGGLSQSFRAWSDRFESDDEGSKFDNYKLPGLSYTREQLFFIAYSQGWARNIKPAEAVKKIRTDPHSPTNFRVIGPLSNNLEFSKAFNCKVGQPMSNVQKCRVW